MGRNFAIIKNIKTQETFGNFFQMRLMGRAMVKGKSCGKLFWWASDGSLKV